MEAEESFFRFMMCLVVFVLLFGIVLIAIEGNNERTKLQAENDSLRQQVKIMQAELTNTIDCYGEE
ncbi:MAG: hypothetical protein HUK07_03555 [Bacteroidaceae bacterium]|nr:hypothetical protein [Bacteroidaceae bacterium]